MSGGPLLMKLISGALALSAWSRASFTIGVSWFSTASQSDCWMTGADRPSVPPVIAAGLLTCRSGSALLFSVVTVFLAVFHAVPGEVARTATVAVQVGGLTTASAWVAYPRSVA